VLTAQSFDADNPPADSKLNPDASTGQLTIALLTDFEISNRGDTRLSD